MNAELAWYATNLTAALLLPPLNLLILAGIGAVLLKRRPRTGKALIVAAFGLLYALSTPLVAESLMGLLEPPPRPIGKDGAGAQAIVVLGSGLYTDAPEYPGGSVSGGALERLQYAAMLHRRTGLPVLISGGRLPGLPAEAPIMKRVMETEFHTPVRWIEARSLNTWDNARLSFAVLSAQGIKRVLVVTHAWHVPRARLAFEAAGFDFVAAPTRYVGHNVGSWVAWDLIPNGRGLMTSYYALHEFIGLAWYRLRAIF